MIIGIPKEILEGEHRVAALPETVREYAAMGFEVLVQAGAGADVFRTDEEYASAGARILDDPQQLFERSDVVLKVKQPVLNTEVGLHEADMQRSGSILITFLHPAAPSNHYMIRKLCDRQITAFTMDGIPRTSRAQHMDALTSMSTVTGYRSMLIAAMHFPKFVPMIGTVIGPIAPASVLVIGAGVVGLQAIATAKRLGAKITALDIRAEACREARSVRGTTILDFDVPQEFAVGKEGYAKALPPEWLEREHAVLAPVVRESDIIILSALVPGEVAPVLITEDMVRTMRPGSVIVDVSIDQGGNCTLTKPGRTTVEHDVSICGTANIPGSMAVHASWLYANNVLHYVQNLFRDGIGKINFDDEVVQQSLVTCNGELLHAGARKAMHEV
jgi:NAD(P) transhydrogenase subunit alpha